MKTLLPIAITIIFGSLAVNTVNAQISFSNANGRLHSDNGTPGSNANNRSGNAVTVVDVNNDGLDDIVKLDDNRYVRIEYQQPGGTFLYQYIGDFGNNNPWGMSVADVDHNGYKDILFCGGSSVRLMKLNNTGTGILGSVITLPGSNIFSQNGNFMDANNDGWEDIFVCNDVGESRIWINDGTGNFPAEANNSVINFNVTPGNNPPNDESGNYGSVWSDFDNDGDIDLYIIHCRQGQSPGDIRRTNVLFENNGNGTYTSNAATYNLDGNDQDWTGSFGDIDNDGDFDLFLTKHDAVPAYYLNNGNGVFSAAAGTLNFGSMPMQALFEDFDNDGFVDLLITGDDDNRLYRNNGNNSFTNVTPSNWAFDNMLSFAAGDLNHDGRIDLYGSYGSTYNNPSGTDDIYWMNTTDNGYHYITLSLQGTSSSLGALGARAYVYGSWGIQTREVRASESYGTCNSFQLHFGLGTSTIIDSVIIDWPANGSPNTVIVNPAVNQFLTIIEGDCVSPDNVITYSGFPVLCPNQSLTLTASSGNGYTYLWSNGDITQSTVVNAVGEYSVLITAPGNNCSSMSGAVSVLYDPDQTPEIIAGGNPEFCEGSFITLSTDPALGYLWTNGDTTQSTAATQTGYYSVTIQGSCQNWTSDSIFINVLPAPAPVGQDVYLSNPAPATVNVTGTNVNWYDAFTGGNLLASGLSYITPTLFTTTTFYAEDVFTYGGGLVHAGAVNHTGVSNYNGSTYNGYQIFDVLDHCVLNQVKVYTNTAGTRTIELRNSQGGVLQSATVNIPVDTSWVTLNFTLTPGTAYQLGTNDSQNNISFGNASPVLKRSSSGVNYPYTVNNVVSITGSSAGNSNYYYFYDWEISLPSTICTSERTPVTVHVSYLGLPENAVNVRIFPNPASGYLNVEIYNHVATEGTITMIDMIGKKVMEMPLGNVEGHFQKTLPLTGISTGVYHVNLRLGNENFHSLIIVE